jgi:hypothetical protein
MNNKYFQIRSEDKYGNMNYEEWLIFFIKYIYDSHNTIASVTINK